MLSSAKIVATLEKSKNKKENSWSLSNYIPNLGITNLLSRTYSNFEYYKLASLIALGYFPAVAAYMPAVPTANNKATIIALGEQLLKIVSMNAPEADHALDQILNGTCGAVRANVTDPLTDWVADEADQILTSAGELFYQLNTQVSQLSPEDFANCAYKLFNKAVELFDSKNAIDGNTVGIGFGVAVGLCCMIGLCVAIYKKCRAHQNSQAVLEIRQEAYQDNHPLIQRWDTLCEKYNALIEKYPDIKIQKPQLPSSYCDPIEHTIIYDPVLLKEGLDYHYYEKSSLLAWLGIKESANCPINAKFTFKKSDVIPVPTHKELIENWLKEEERKLILLEKRLPKKQEMAEKKKAIAEKKAKPVKKKKVKENSEVRLTVEHETKTSEAHKEKKNNKLEEQGKDEVVINIANDSDEKQPLIPKKKRHEDSSKNLIHHSKFKVVTKPKKIPTKEKEIQYIAQYGFGKNFGSV